jgi:hypothetical protein
VKGVPIAGIAPTTAIPVGASILILLGDIMLAVTPGGNPVDVIPSTLLIVKYIGVIAVPLHTPIGFAILPASTVIVGIVFTVILPVAEIGLHPPVVFVLIV